MAYSLRARYATCPGSMQRTEADEAQLTIRRLRMTWRRHPVHPAR
jgi:hypothetical protein